MMILLILCLLENDGDGGDDLGEVGVHPVEDVVVIAGVFSATFGHHLTHRLPDGQKRFVEITLFPWKLRPFVPFPGNDTA